MQLAIARDACVKKPLLRFSTNPERQKSLEVGPNASKNRSNRAKFVKFVAESRVGGGGVLSCDRETAGGLAAGYAQLDDVGQKVPRQLRERVVRVLEPATCQP